MTAATFESLSRQFDSTREEIIANFRQRINQGKRSKLTKQELEELIDIFISCLQSTDDSETISQLCQAEIALLEEGYPAASVAKNYLTKYRKAIATAIDEKRIELTSLNSHDYTYVKDGAEQITTEHWALTYLKYSQADYEQFARSTIVNNNLKQDSLQPIALQLYLEAVSALLNSSQPLELAIAIAAASGRRYSEVMARGSFEPTDHLYQIRFSGQLKKRNSQGADEYLIYTLVSASKVLDALERFRTHPDIAAIESASIEQINQPNTPLNRLVKHYFQDSHLVPVLRQEAGVTVQNLRGIYGEIAIHFFCPPTMGTHRFIQQKLGHLISDSQLTQRKNSGSTEHYFHYYLVDRQGKQLAEKGVLLYQLSLNSEDTHSINPNATESEQLERTARNLEPTSNDEILPASSETKVDTSAANLTSPTVKSETSDRVLPNHRSDLPKGGGEANRPITKVVSPIENQSQTLETGQRASQLSSALDFSEFVTRVRTLIESDDYRFLLVGLMAVTGLDAASLLKLLVFKQAAAPHLILYCQQLHPSDRPLQQLLTLLNADEVIEAISKLRRHPEAIDFAHRLTGSELNSQVSDFIPDVLRSLGLSENLDLVGQYQDLIPLLLQENISDRSSKLSLAADTRANFERWQHHFQTNADRTLYELMRLSATALASQNSQPQSLPSEPIDALSSSNEPNPWLAISHLTTTVARLSERLSAQNDRLFDLVLGGSSSSETTPSNRVSKPKPATSPPKPSPKSASQSNSSGDRPKSALSSEPKSESVSSPVASNSAALTTDDSLAQLSSKELRHNRSPGAPAEKLARALDALIVYNQNQERPEQMWRINTSILQQLTGCFNASVKDFVALHQETIDAHNRALGLTSVRHNTAHKGQDPNSFIHW
jgi:hypothetical protein